MAAVTPASNTIADDVLYEVVDGQIVEKPPMGAFNTWLAALLQNAMGPFASENQLGCVVSEMLFVLGGARKLKRRPDVAFVSSARWPIEQPIPDDEAWDVVPDLAVEIISRSNSAIDVNVKIHEYFRAGVQGVWVIYPKTQEVYVYTSVDSIKVLSREAELVGEPLLPGFRLPLKSLFRTKAD